MLTGLLVVLLAIAGRPAWAAETRPRIAVLEFQPVRADLAEATATADQLRTELVNLGVFTVLDRSQTASILGELAFQQEGITDPAQATELGRLLNVQYIVTGRVTRLVGAYQVNVQMIDVKTGEIVRSESALHRGDFVGLLSAQLPRLASRLSRVGTVPPPPIALSPPPPGSAETPERSQARLPREVAPRRWPMMGMMVGLTDNWPLVLGGVMLMGAAMLAGHANGENRDAAVGVAVIGVGLLGYYWINRTTTNTAEADDELAWPRPVVLVGLAHEGMGAGVAWRW
jgi:TolB-like protein